MKKHNLSLATVQLIGLAEVSTAPEALTRAPRRATAYTHIKLNDSICARLSLDKSKPSSWAKLHVDYLDDDRLMSLPMVTRGVFFSLVLLVQRRGFNHLPNDNEQLARAIGEQDSDTVARAVANLLTKGLLNPVKRLRTKSRDARADKDKDKEKEQEQQTDAHSAPVESSRSSSSKFSFDQILKYAHAHPSIKEPVKFAGARKRTGESDAEIEAWFAGEKRAARKADKNCGACFGSGFDSSSGAAKRCACIA